MIFLKTQKPLDGSSPAGHAVAAGKLPRPGWTTGRRAAAAVEFAVVALVFFPMLLGILEVGRGLMVGHVLTVAAARGCRIGVIEGKANTDVTAAVQTILAGSGITGQNVTVQVKNVTADCSTAQAGDEVTVIVSVPVSKVTWVPAGKYLSGNISAQYTLLRE